jgi:hypothetical protein
VIDFLDPLQTLAYGLGIPIYVDDAGRPQQHGPGRRINPGENAGPRKHGAPLKVESDAAAT